MTRKLWAATLLLWVPGDLATTLLGLQLGAAEQNAIVTDAMQYGVPGMVTLKLLVAALVYGLGQLLTAERGETVAVSALLTVSVVTVLWNSFVILTLL